MKLTPLGKALIFLIGFGLVVTAVYRFVPAEQQPWRKWLGDGSEAPASPEAPETAQEAPAAPGEASPSSPASPSSTPAADRPAKSTSEWVSIPGGLFRTVMRSPNSKSVFSSPFSP